MENLMLKIKKMVEDNGQVKFEDTSIFGKAAAAAAYKGMIREYAKTAGHTVYTVSI